MRSMAGPLTSEIATMPSASVAWCIRPSAESSGTVCWRPRSVKNSGRCDRGQNDGERQIDICREAQRDTEQARLR